MECAAPKHLLKYTTHDIDFDEYSPDDQESGTEEEEDDNMNQINSDTDKLASSNFQGEIQDDDSVEDSREDLEFQSDVEGDPNVNSSDSDQQENENDSSDANTGSDQTQSDEESLDSDSEADQDIQGEIFVEAPDRNSVEKSDGDKENLGNNLIHANQQPHSLTMGKNNSLIFKSKNVFLQGFG